MKTPYEFTDASGHTHLMSDFDFECAEHITVMTDCDDETFVDRDDCPIFTGFAGADLLEAYERATPAERRDVSSSILTRLREAREFTLIDTPRNYGILEG